MLKVWSLEWGDPSPSRVKLCWHGKGLLPLFENERWSITRLWGWSLSAAWSCRAGLGPHPVSLAATDFRPKTVTATEVKFNRWKVKQPRKGEQFPSDHCWKMDALASTHLESPLQKVRKAIRITCLSALHTSHFTSQLHATPLSAPPQLWNTSWIL
jgi:hypothetical protein